MVKGGNERGGDGHDAPSSGGPTNITDMMRRKVDLVFHEEPWLPPRQIASKANVGLGHSAVDNIIFKSKF
jgi:hypothetical protein